MKLLLLTLCVAVCPVATFGQTKKAPLPSHPNNPATQEIQTETIGAPGQTPRVPSAPATGALEPAQVKSLAHKIWLAEYRLNDLLTQVHPENWKISTTVRQSFDQSLDSLQKALAAQEYWRGQFETRPDSIYMGFQTYIAIGAVLPRLDGVAHAISQYVNPGFGAQYSQSANQFFDLQQTLAPHLSYLLKNQDNYLQLAQTNLAACQNELNFAEHNKEGRATPMKNIAPDFKGRRRTAHSTAAATSSSKSAPAARTAGKSTADPPDSTAKK